MRVLLVSIRGFSGMLLSTDKRLTAYGWNLLPALES